MENSICGEMDEHGCDKCLGLGIIKHESSDISITCEKCHGDGKLDWLEMVCGKSGHYFKSWKIDLEDFDTLILGTSSR